MSALARLDTTSVAFDKAREDARSEALSRQTLLWLPTDVARQSASAAARQELVHEFYQYRSLFFALGNGRSFADSPDPLALKVLLSGYDSLAGLPEKEVVRLIREKEPWFALSDGDLYREINREASKLALQSQQPAIGFQALDLDPGFPKISSVLSKIAQERSQLIDGKPIAEAVNSARTALNDTLSDTWPSWLGGVWESKGSAYFVALESTPRIFRFSMQSTSKVGIASQGAETLAEH